MIDPMTMLLLDGAARDDAAAGQIRRALADESARRGWRDTVFFLPELEIVPCAGDFACWTRHPGECAIDGPHRAIAREMMAAGLLVWLTPVTFGGYSSDLKKALDHLIPNISPLFTRVGGETHHRLRYRRYPRLLVVGTLRQQDADAERVFRALAARNALNLFPPGWTTVVIQRGRSDQDVAMALSDALSMLAGRP